MTYMCFPTILNICTLGKSVISATGSNSCCYLWHKSQKKSLQWDDIVDPVWMRGLICADIRYPMYDMRELS